MLMGSDAYVMLLKPDLVLLERRDNTSRRYPETGYPSLLG
jgi:hypothetical protein